MALKGHLTNPDGIHLNEAAFRRYEETIAAMLSNYPEPYFFKIGGLALTSVAARLRDAVNALLTHGYDTYIDVAQLRDVWPTLRVLVCFDSVLVTTKEQQKVAALNPVAQRSAPMFSLTLTNPSHSVLTAATVLIREGHVTNPIILQGSMPEGWQIPNGIVLDQQPDGSYLML